MREVDKIFSNDAVVKKLPRWVLVASVLTIIVTTSFLAVFTVAAPTLNHMLDKEITEVKKELEEYKGKIVQQDKMLVSQQDSISALQKQITAIELEKQKLQTEITIMKASYSQQIEVLQEKIENLEKEKKELEEKLDKQRLQQNVFEKQINNK